METESNDYFLDMAELYARGWTESLIMSFLGSPHMIEPVNHWLNHSGKRVYYLGWVEKIENLQKFKESYEKSIKRRKLKAAQIRAFSAERGKTKGILKAFLEQLTEAQLKEYLNKYAWFTGKVAEYMYYEYWDIPNNAFWIQVTNELRTEYVKKPAKSKKNILVYAKKHTALQTDLFSFTYEFYNSNLEINQIKEGNFTCIKAFETVPKTKEEVYWFGYEISDSDGVIRKEEFISEGLYGIPKLIKRLRTAANFENWSEYEKVLKRIGKFHYMDEYTEEWEIEWYLDHKR